MKTPLSPLSRSRGLTLLGLAAFFCFRWPGSPLRRAGRSRHLGRGLAGSSDVAYDVTFAFVFRAFRPEGAIRR